MSEAQFMGMLISALVVLIGLASTIVLLIIRPIINLNKSITKLNASIDKLNGDNVRIESIVNKHTDKLDEHEQQLIRLDCDVKNLKEKEIKK